MPTFILVKLPVPVYGGVPPVAEILTVVVPLAVVTFRVVYVAFKASLGWVVIAETIILAPTAS